MTILDITIPKALPSWNEFYAGKHWARRHQLVDDWDWRVAVILNSDYSVEHDYPLILDVEVSKPHHVLDSSNICAKLVEDALKGRVIVDDSPEYVSEVRTRSVKGEEYTRVRLYSGTIG